MVPADLVINIAWFYAKGAKNMSGNTYNVKNYHEQGGDTWWINGNLFFGANAVVKFNGVDITALFSDYSTGVVTATEIVTDAGTGTTSSGAVTIDHITGVVTTESLTTTAGNSATLVITNNKVKAGDTVQVTMMGSGTNTRNYTYTAEVTADSTITVKIKNIEASNAFNGTFLFQFTVFKVAA